MTFYADYYQVSYSYIFRCFLAAGHVLAVDAKNLLDVIDSIRRSHLALSHCY